MAYKYREELVGKRFLSVSYPGKLKLSKISDWEWRAGVIRAATHRNPKNSELSVLVEFDDVEWKRREWIRVYEENLFQVFAIECTVVWLPRKQAAGSKVLSTYWPGVNYNILVDTVGLSDCKHLPVEYLVDRNLAYVDYADLKPHQVDLTDNNYVSVVHNHPDVAGAIGHWAEYQDGQRILLTTPSVLVGYRVEVYRAEGTTQWYTAVIVSYNENTKELTLTDDTVLEEHNEDPSLVQMRLIGDGVVESILRGENIGITPRRRSCTAQHQQHLGHYTRTRSQITSQLQCHRTLHSSNSRKARVRIGNEVGNSHAVDNDKAEKEKGSSFVKDKKIKTSSVEHHENPLANNCDVQVNKRSKNSLKNENSNCCHKNNHDNSSGSNCNNRGSDLESENDDAGLEAVKSSHQLRRRPKESNNLRNSCGKSKEVVHSDVPNSFKESDEAEHRHSLEKSKSELKSKLKEKSSKEKKCSGRSQEKGKSNARTCSPSDNSVERDLLISQQQRTKVKKCSVIVGAVERTSFPDNELKKTTVDSLRLSPVLETPKEEASATVVQSSITNSCSRVEAGEGHSSDDGAVECRLSSPSKPSRISEEQPPQPSADSQSNVAEKSEILKCSTLDSQVAERCSEQEVVAVSTCNRQQQQKDLSVSVAGMSPVSYVKSESENVINGEQARLRCTPTSSSSSSPLVINSTEVCNNRGDYLVASESNSGSMRDSETNRTENNSVIKVRKVEETCSTRNSQASNSLALDPNEPVRIWRDPKLVGSDSSVFHITSVQHSTMAHPTGARSHSYSSGGSGGGGGGGGNGSLQQQSQHPRSSSSTTPTNLGLQSHFPQHMSPVPHPSMAHPSSYLEHPQANIRIPSGSNPVVAPQHHPPPPPPQPSVPSPHQYPSHPSHMLAQHHLIQPYHQPIHNMDLVWQQKYSQPWMIHQFPDDRDRAAAAILRDRERQARLIDKERRDHAEHLERAKEKHERMEQERRNQEKLEKDKLERERIQKERHELERLKKEKAEKEREQRERTEREQERTRREVQQHFEDSLRLAQYKHPSAGWNIVPRQPMPETGGPNATSSHHAGDGGRVSSRNLAVVHSNHSHPMSPYPNSHKPADLSKESRMIVAGDPRCFPSEEQRRLTEEEKWSVMKRQQESAAAMAYNSISPASRNSDVQQRSTSAHGHYSGQEASHNQSIRTKQEYPVTPNFSPSPKSSSVPMSNSGGGSGVKMEQSNANYSIYGYQAVVHNYMVPDRRGPMVATVPDNHKINPSDLEPNRTAISGPVSQSANVPPQSHSRSGRCSPLGMQYTVKDTERHRRSNHGSVIVCGDNVRHDNCKVASPIMSPKHQTKLSHNQTSEVTNSVYDSATAFKTYEGIHGQQSVSNDIHMDRVLSQMHQYGEPQNFHKSSVTPHEQHHYVSRVGHSRTNLHQSPTPSSNYGPNVMSNISPPSGGSSKSATPVNYGSDLIQQGLVPNPMYNHSSGSGRSITHGASMHLNTAPPVPTSPGQKMSKSSSQSTTNLSLPARSSPGAIYGKASIVAGTPLCRPSTNVGQSPTHMAANYSLHTPPPAHHNGGRNQPDHTRPASAHSQPPLPGPPPSHTATTGQSSHSPIDRSVSGSSRTGSSSSLTGMSPSNPEVMYSSPIPPVSNLNVNLPPVPSPVSMASGGLGGYSGSSVSSRQLPVIMLQSPPQTQPLDLQAPDRQRDSRSASPGKRKSSKDGLQRKRPKTVVMSVANEGLAAAVASVHHIMSNNNSNSVNGPRSSASTFVTNVSPAPPPSAVTPTSVVTTTNVNTGALDSVPKPVLAPVGVTTTPVSSIVNTTATTTQVIANKDSGFFNSFRTFVHSSQQNPSQNVPNYTTYPYGKHKGKHMAAKSNLAQTIKQEEVVGVCNKPANSPVKVSTGTTTSQSCVTVSTPSVSCSTAVTSITTAKPSQSVTVQPTTVNNVSSEQPEKAISPALSNASSTSTCGASIPKLKKEWLIRHSNEDGKNSGKADSVDLSQAAVASLGSTTVTAFSVASAGSVILDNASTVPDKEAPNVGSANSIPASSAGSRSTASDASVNGHVATTKSETGTNESNSVDNSETESVSTTSTVKSGTKRKTRSNNKKTPKKEVRSSKTRHVDHSESNQEDEKDVDADDEPQAKRVAVSSHKRRGRKPKSKSTRADAVRKTKSAKSSSTKMKQPTVARLKRTGESFLQKGPCCDVAPKLSKCRECRMSQHQRSKKMPNIFCRFYEFRRLKYTKNGFITTAGFSEPKDASEDDLKLWLPPVESPASDLKVDTSFFILTHVGDQFCDLVEQEREAQAMHMSEDKTIAWKRVVQGVREMCDVCETTLFNIHWACSKCGFVVCIDCYKARRNGTVKEEESPGKDRDSYSWLMCNSKQMHEQDNLMLTQIIAGNALWDMGQFVHEIRKKWQIANYCSCSLSKAENNNNTKKPVVNGLCKQLMSAVSKCFESDGVKESTNGGSEAIKNSKLSKVNNNVNGSLDYIKQEGVAGYNPDNSSPLSWLADVALNSSVKLEGGSNKNKENHREAKDGKDSNRQSPNYSSDTDDGKNSENYSTLRELLIRPTSKSANGNKNNSVAPGSKKKISTLDEVISHVIEQSVNIGTERLSKEAVKLMHYTKRFPHPKTGRDPLPIRVFTLEESKVLYPDVPHSWLCNGRLLRLVDPDHKGNLKLFQEQWRRGQPVLVSEINKRLDIDLWHPDSFSRDYGDKKNDLVNCSTGAIVPNQPMRKFWEGFETYSKRMKDENGEYMLLKLKDWPPGDDFSEMLPSRFEDLMKALPLPEYTHRNGLLNIAGRLPECFVRPDLGPKMYNAYGSAMHPDKGTTNLHLDISDAVNVMVYVGIPKDSDSVEDMQEAFRAIEEGGCDTITLRRVREKGSKPGALWHIYNARDADKIRDLLNKVAIERGETPEAHHDPIHDQSWYLDGFLRERLYKEYGVEGYAIAQCLGDAVFIPAGAPHQVRNLHSCIKVAEDFVSPENISHCFTLTQEFRDLSDTHTNHEDKLQVKNIIYHAVRDALALLMRNDPSSYKDLVKSI
ncbi:hypothetical protein CHUAL_009201 [Chamberlinius hualienensis]